MDTSETYLKMCDCPEIQKLWKPKLGDWYWNIIGHMECIRMERVTDKRRKFHSKINYNEEKNFIWLPRQDQIQEMLPFSNLAPHALLLCFWNFVDKDIEHIFIYTSMEQLWLAFYQKEVHNKTWSGKEWV